MIQRLKLPLLLILIFIGQPLPARQKLPIIRATSKTVDIRDGVSFQKGTWTITPSLKPDIYQAKSKRVSFHTDLDSISFNVKPDHKYDFIIVLNGKDSAYTQVIYVPSFLEILKKASKYDYDDTREINRFTYKSKNDSDLVALRTVFKLDSVAGTGNEISQILNLMHWVHNQFPHDGAKEIPDHSGIIDLMTKCIAGKHTLHCGALAEVFNACCLSMGFISRRVVCLPKDSTDYDCHSINSVYAKTVHKWLWIDPTNDAYVMDEKGGLLGISEVREGLIYDKPLILNPEANWNHVRSVIKEDYLYNYMAKNLYAFQCYVTGGGESQSNLLLPVEYKGVIPRTAINKPKCTNNPTLFWANPE
jgi:hypothetical protein